MWYTMVGRNLQFSGTVAGTVSLPGGAILYMVAVRASSAANATLQIFGGPTITIPQADTATTIFFFEHTLFQAGASAASQNIVIGGTPSMYYINAVLPGNGN